MKQLIASTAIALVLVGIAAAEPIKCTVDGEILYTDDIGLCGKSGAKAVDGNLTVFPKVGAANKSPAKSSARATPVVQPTVQPAAPDVSITDSLLEQFGISQQDIANGWKTIMDASHRGSWQAPEMPDEEE